MLRELKTTFNLTEVSLKKKIIWSILPFRSKEIKVYYKLKQPLKIDKQKSSFFELYYAIKTPFT